MPTKNHLTITIGIPAYNEAHNIVKLVKTILVQSHQSYQLERIVVCCDGCTDGTRQAVASLNNPLVVAINGRRRLGQGERQNQIIKASSSDILVLLNADILIPDPNFLDKLVQPIVNGQADLVVPSLLPLAPRSFFEQVLYTGFNIKKRMIEKHNHGDNIFTCFGAARALSRQLYRQLLFKKSVGEDAYSFLFSKFNTFRYQYLPTCHVYFRLPDNFPDHQKQSLRYRQSKRDLIQTTADDFGANFVASHYGLPNTLAFMAVVSSLVTAPVATLIYLVTVTFISLQSAVGYRPQKNTWSISRSSKLL